MNAIIRSEMEFGWRIFLPAPSRGLTSTNDALEQKFCDGFRKAGSKSTRKDVYRYNELAREIRQLVMLAANHMDPIRGLVDVKVTVCPHKEWDDDAGLINAKWVVDGFVDAGVWRKDRRVIRWVSVRTDLSREDDPGIVIEIERVPS
jgi:hypothetical protein